MKTAVSIPDDVFEQAEELIRRTRESRSRLYSRAVAEYVARHVPDRVTEAMDHALADLDEPADPFVPAASRRVLRRSSW
jgi:metal-responsive CopG/Arc/MetJ family transcriptional regulator